MMSTDFKIYVGNLGIIVQIFVLTELICMMNFRRKTPGHPQTSCINALGLAFVGDILYSLRKFYSWGDPTALKMSFQTLWFL